MMKKILMVAAMVAMGTAAVAQTDGRSLLDAKKFWTAGGSEQTNKTVKDPSIAGGRYIEMTSTGKNSKYSANVSYRIVTPVKAGEKLRISGMAKAAAPTTVTLAWSLVDAPYTGLDRGTLNLTTEWKPFTIELVAKSDQPANVTRLIVELNSEARTVSFGPLTATASVQ